MRIFTFRNLLLILLPTEDPVIWVLLTLNTFCFIKAKLGEKLNFKIEPNLFLGLDSELVDWYRDATCVSYDLLSFDLSPSTNRGLRYCINIESLHSNFCNPYRLKHLKSLDGERTKSLYSPNVPINFPQMRQSFLSIVSKIVDPVSVRRHSQTAKRKPVKHKRTSSGKVSKRDSVALALKKKTTWKQRKDLLASQNGLQVLKVKIPPFIYFLSLHGAVGFRPCVCVQQQEIQYLVSYEAKTSNVSN